MAVSQPCLSVCAVSGGILVHPPLHGCVQGHPLGHAAVTGRGLRQHFASCPALAELLLICRIWFLMSIPHCLPSYFPHSLCRHLFDHKTRRVADVYSVTRLYIVLGLRSVVYSLLSFTGFCLAGLFPGRLFSPALQHLVVQFVKILAGAGTVFHQFPETGFLRLAAQFFLFTVFQLVEGNVLDLSWLSACHSTL